MTAFSGSGGFGGDFYTALKHIYNPKAVAKMANKNRPLWEKLSKRDMFVGDTYNHSMFFEDPQGASADFATAIAQKQASSQGARFVMNRGRLYQAVSILNEEIAASRDNEGSLLRKKSTETAGVVNNMANRADDFIHGGGAGVIASFTTTGSNATTTITLDTPQMQIKFSKGQTLQVATTNNTNGTVNTLLNSGASVKVVAVNRSATTSTITVDQQLSTAFPSIATTTQYFLLNKGDNLGFGINSFAGGVSGLKSWFPITAPTAGDNFWGYDRSTDSRTSGTRYVGTNGEKYETTFQNASAELSLYQSNPNVVLVHPLDYAKYSQELGNKVRYASSSEGSTGFKPLVIDGQTAQMTLLADPKMDPGSFYMLDMDTLWLATLGSVPHLDESAGRDASREPTTDGIEMRWRGWFQLVCDRPISNLVGSFAP